MFKGVDSQSAFWQLGCAFDEHDVVMIDKRTDWIKCLWNWMMKWVLTKFERLKIDTNGCTIKRCNATGYYVTCRKSIHWMSVELSACLIKIPMKYNTFYGSLMKKSLGFQVLLD